MIDKKFRSDIWFGYITQGAVALIGLLFMFVVTRYGSVAVYGALTLLVSLSRIMGNLLTFRTNEALVAFYKQGESTGNIERCKFAILASVYLDLIVGFVLLFIMILLSDVLAHTMLKDADAAEEVVLFGYVLLSILLKSSPFALLQAIERMKWVNSISLGENFVKLTIVSYFAFTTQALSLQEVIYAVLASSIGAVLISYSFLIKELIILLRSTSTSRDHRLIRDYVGFSIKTFASSTLKSGNQNIDVLVLGFITNTHTVGIYATFRQFLSPFSFLTSPISAVSYPRFIKAVVQHHQEEIRGVIVNINKKLIFIFSTMAMVIFPALILYSYINDLQLDYMDYFAFCVMAFSSIISGLLWWARPFSNSIEPNLSLFANFFSTVFLIIVLYPATWAFGLIGTSLSILASVTLLLVYWIYVLNRYA